MTDYIRRIVSGNKARFKDGKLNLELDLVYITDQVIIMGFPAAGIEGLYRNRREDAKKFLDHRHGKNYWVFNFCPLKENSYPADTFDGRVSRYPFPDHHAPPLAIMPLVAREMRIWLNGSPDRVAVLHCKAGKGRSGTMACAYLLACDDEVTAPRLERSYDGEQWAKLRADELMDTIPEDDPKSEIKSPIPSTILEDNTANTTVDSPVSTTPEPAGAAKPPPKSYTDALDAVLDLHTSRRMKAPSQSGKAKQGVSIPSQRRFLYYWSLLLSHQAPIHLWATEALVPSPSPSTESSILSMPISEKRPRPKVRLTEIKLRMRELSNMRHNLVRAANAIIDRTSMGKSGSVAARADGNAPIWVSLARYDDDFVETLERWERYTRLDSENGQGNMGIRASGKDHFGKEILSELFNGGRWDNKKMVRSFARLGVLDKEAITKEETEKDGKIKVYALRPLTSKKWKDIQTTLKDSQEGGVINPEAEDIPASEANSMYDLTQNVKEKGVVLDAGREARVKLYMGQVFMGWAWFIPSFHMPQPSPNSDASQPQPSSTSAKLLLTRKELDFPLGVGSSIIDVEISLEWLKESEFEAVQPPARVSTEQEEAEASEPSGLAATVEAVTAGDVKGVVEAKQAAED